MISAVNSTRFASANNYKRTYTNTNQNTNQSTIGYQQSFGATKTPKLALAILSALVSLVNPALAENATKKSGDLAGKTAVKIADTVSDCTKRNFSDFVKATLTPNSSFSHPPIHPCLIEDAQETAKRSVAERRSNRFTYAFPDYDGHSFAFDYDNGKITSYSIASSDIRMGNEHPTGSFGNFEQREYQDVNEDGSFARMELSTYRKDGSIGGFKVWEKSKPDADAPFDSVTSFPASLPKEKIEYAQHANPAMNNAQDGVFEFTTADNLKGAIEKKNGKIYSYSEGKETQDGELIVNKYFDENGNGAFEQYRIFYLDSNDKIKDTQYFVTDFDQNCMPYKNAILDK